MEISLEKGGGISGNGGFVEISSPKFIDPNGIVNLSAARGQSGTLLLDPSNITVTTAVDANIAWSGGDPNSATGTANSANVQISNMLTNLQTASVIIDATGGGAAGAGNITITDPIAITNAHDGNTLYFKAYNNFLLSDPITVTGSTCNVAIASGFDTGGTMIIDTNGSITFDNASSGDLIIVAQGTGSGDMTFTGPASPSKVISFKSSGTCHISTEGETINLGGSIGSQVFVEGDNITINGEIEIENGNLIVRCADDLDINDPMSLTGDGAHELSSNTEDVLIDDVITLTGTTSGSLLVESPNTIDIDGSGSILVNGTASLTLNSTGDDVVIESPITMNTTGTLAITAFGDIYIEDSVINSHANSGNMTITAGSDLLIDGTGTNVIARIGAVAGTINVSATGNMILTGGDTAGIYAQVGYSGGSSSQNINISSIGGGLLLQGGIQGEDNCYTIIGHGLGTTAAAPYTYSGNVTISSIGGDLILNGGSSDACFAQIGHTRGIGQIATNSGNISILDVLGTVELTGGSAQGSYSIIGHGGRSSTTADSYSGSVSVAQSGAAVKNISIISGTQTQSFAGIGHIGHKIGSVGGALTISSVPEIKVQGNNEITLSSKTLSESFIGARVVGTAGATGNISLTKVEVITANNGDLTLKNISTDANFHGTIIGAYANTDQLFPLTSAGNASSDVVLTIDGNLTLDTGLQTNTSKVYTYITNYGGTPNGTSTIVANVAKSCFLRGGGGYAAITSAGPLTLSSSAVQLSSPVGTDLDKKSIISANGITNITTGETYIIGNINGASSSIENSSGLTTITTMGNMTLQAKGLIDVTGGSGDLTINVGTASTGTLALIAESIIRNQGTGSVSLATGGNLFIQSAYGSDTFLISNGLLTLNVGQDLILTASSTGDASILSAGNTTISSENYTFFGAHNHSASIINSSGYLTLNNEENISISHNSLIQLTAGSGLLKINSGTEGSGDILISNNSNISHGGTGNIEIIFPDHLQLLSGNEGASTISSNAEMSITGAVLTVSSSEDGSGSITAKGNSTFNLEHCFMQGKEEYNAKIENTTGNIVFNTSKGLLLQHYSSIDLTGGSGNISINVATGGIGDFYIDHASYIRNQGTGNISILTPINFSLTSGYDNPSYVSTSSGNISIATGGNLTIFDLDGGDAYFSSGGNLNVTCENFYIGGETTSNNAYLKSTGGNISVTSLNDISFGGNSYISNTGSGSITIVVDQQAPTSPSVGQGRFIMTDDSYIQTNGGTLRVFTAKPQQNFVNGSLNGQGIVGTLTNQQYSTYYNAFAGGGGTPFTVYYKIPGVKTPDLRLIAINGSELEQIIDREMNKTPLDYRFDLFIDSSDTAGKLHEKKI